MLKAMINFYKEKVPDKKKGITIVNERITDSSIDNRLNRMIFVSFFSYCRWLQRSSDVCLGTDQSNMVQVIIPITI